MSDGMNALRQLCAQHGTPINEQSQSDEDIVLWAEAKMNKQQAEIERLRDLLAEREQAANWLYLQLCEYDYQLRAAVIEADRRFDWITGD